MFAIQRRRLRSVGVTSLASDPSQIGRSIFAGPGGARQIGRLEISPLRLGATREITFMPSRSAGGFFTRASNRTFPAGWPPRMVGPAGPAPLLHLMAFRTGRREGKMGAPWCAIGAPPEKTKSAPLRHWVFSLVGAPPSMAQTCLRLWCARVEHTARRVRTYERRQGLITLGITDGGHGKSTQLARP